MGNIINCCYMYYIKKNKCYFSMLISNSNNVISESVNYYRNKKVLAGELGVKHLFRKIERMEREGRISCEDKVNIYLDDEILYKQLLTGSGFNKYALRRRNRLTDLSSRLKMHKNWVINYDMEEYNKLSELLVHKKERKSSLYQKKSIIILFAKQKA